MIGKRSIAVAVAASTIFALSGAPAEAGAGTWLEWANAVDSSRDDGGRDAQISLTWSNNGGLRTGASFTSYGEWVSAYNSTNGKVHLWFAITSDGIWTNEVLDPGETYRERFNQGREGQAVSLKICLIRSNGDEDPCVNDGPDKSGART